jgi:hypothetical protein
MTVALMEKNLGIVQLVQSVCLMPHMPDRSAASDFKVPVCAGLKRGKGFSVYSCLSKGSLHRTREHLPKSELRRPSLSNFFENLGYKRTRGLQQSIGFQCLAVVISHFCLRWTPRWRGKRTYLQTAFWWKGLAL